MKTYQEKVDSLIKEKIVPTKIYLAYEINCVFDCECNDDLIDEIYQAFWITGIITTYTRLFWQCGIGAIYTKRTSI